jgi:hypothetical protein
LEEVFDGGVFLAGFEEGDFLDLADGLGGEAEDGGDFAEGLGARAFGSLLKKLATAAGEPVESRPLLGEDGLDLLDGDGVELIIGELEEVGGGHD